MFSKQFKLLLALLVIIFGFAVLVANQITLSNRLTMLEQTPVQTAVIHEVVATPSATVTVTKAITQTPTKAPLKAATTSGRLK